MEQLNIFYLNVWSITITCLAFYILYEDSLYRNLVQTEAKRDYYPLNFRSAKIFQFMEVDEKQDESVSDPAVMALNSKSILNQRGYEVVDRDGSLQYKFIRTKSTLLTQEWKMFEIRSDQLSVSDEDHVAVIHINPKWSIFNKDIYFPLRRDSTYLNHHPEQPLSAIRHEQLNNHAAPVSILSSPLSAGSGTGNYSSPYIEPALQNNQYVKRGQLGDAVEYNPHPTLHLQEDQKLSRVHVKYEHKFKTGFWIQKNSDFVYNWNPSSYLEKTMVQKQEYATERIGFMLIGDSYVKLFVNDLVLDPKLAITSGFLHYVLNYK